MQPQPVFLPCQSIRIPSSPPSPSPPHHQTPNTTPPHFRQRRVAVYYEEIEEEGEEVEQEQTNDEAYVYKILVSPQHTLVTCTNSCFPHNAQLTFYRYDDMSRTVGTVGSLKEANQSRFVNAKFIDESVVVGLRERRWCEVWDLRQAASRPAMKINAGTLLGTSELLGLDVLDNRIAISGGTDFIVGDLRAHTVSRETYRHFSEFHTDRITQTMLYDRFVMTGGDDGCVNVFDLSNVFGATSPGVTEEDLLDDALVQVFNAVDGVEEFGLFGNVVTQGQLYVYSNSQTHDLKLWSVKTGNEMCSSLNRRALMQADYLISTRYYQHNDTLCTFAGTNNGEVLVCKVGIVDNKPTFEPLLELNTQSDQYRKIHNGVVRSIWTSENMDTILTGGEDSTLCMWRPPTIAG